MRSPILFALAVTACVADSDGKPGGRGGKGDDPLVDEAPTQRRVMDAVACPLDEPAVKVAFFDADSTIRVSKSGTVTANSELDVNVLPFAARELARLEREGYLIAVVSNQGGVGSGHQTFETAEGALAFATAQLARLGGPVHYFDFAESYDDYRKPKTGMAKQLDANLVEWCGIGIDQERSFMVGDSGYKKGVDGPHPDGRPADDFSSSDRLFAENYGIPFHEPTDYFGWRAYEVFNIAKQSELVELLDKIDARAEELRMTGGDAAEISALEAEARSNREVNGL